MRYVEQGAQRLRAKVDIEEGAVVYLYKNLESPRSATVTRLWSECLIYANAKFFGLPDSGRLPVVVIYRKASPKAWRAKAVQRRSDSL